MLSPSEHDILIWTLMNLLSFISTDMCQTMSYDSYGTIEVLLLCLIENY